MGSFSSSVALAAVGECSKTHFRVDFCQFCTASDLNPCRFGTKKCETDTLKESRIMTFSRLCWKLKERTSQRHISRARLTPKSTSPSKFRCLTTRTFAVDSVRLTTRAPLV